MREKMKSEIVTSYRTLIENCKREVDNGVNLETNKNLLQEYSRMLSAIMSKDDDYYEDIENKKNEIYEVSLLIENFLNPIKPYTEKNI